MEVSAFLRRIQVRHVKSISELFTYLGLIGTIWLELHLSLSDNWHFFHTQRTNLLLAYLGILRYRIYKLVHWGMTHHESSYKMKCIKRKPRQICIFLNGIAGWEVSHVCLLPCCLNGGWLILTKIAPNTDVSPENRHKYNLQDSWLHPT